MALIAALMTSACGSDEEASEGGRDSQVLQGEARGVTFSLDGGALLIDAGEAKPAIAGRLQGEQVEIVCSGLQALRRWPLDAEQIRVGLRIPPGTGDRTDEVTACRLTLFPGSSPLLSTEMD